MECQLLCIYYLIQSLPITLWSKYLHPYHRWVNWGLENLDNPTQGPRSVSTQQLGGARAPLFKFSVNWSFSLTEVIISLRRGLCPFTLLPPSLACSARQVGMQDCKQFSPYFYSQTWLQITVLPRICHWGSGVWILIIYSGIQDGGLRTQAVKTRAGLKPWLYHPSGATWQVI